MLKQIFKVIDGLIEDQDEKIELLGIGAGSPGIIKDERLVSFSPNIPFRDFDLGEKIVKRYNVPFVLGNDVNVAMYGEWKAAHIVDAKNVLGILLELGLEAPS